MLASLLRALTQNKAIKCYSKIKSEEFLGAFYQ